MVGSNPYKETAAAPAANTDTIIFTPAIGQIVKLLAAMATNKGAAGAAGHVFEVRHGANVKAAFGFDSATAPIGMSKQVVMNDTIIGDGVTPVQIRNLVVGAASEIFAYSMAIEVIAPGQLT